MYGHIVVHGDFFGNVVREHVSKNVSSVVIEFERNIFEFSF